MNNHKEAYEIKESQSQKPLYSHSGGYLYVGEYRVMPDYVHLMEVPFSWFVSIRFKQDKYKNPNRKRLHRYLINRCIEYVNKVIRVKYPSKIQRNKSIRCVLKREIGDSLEGICHVHLLVLVDERVRDLINRDVEWFFSYLTKRFPNTIESVVIQPIRDKERQISYFCKIDQKIDPYCDYLQGLLKIMKKFYPMKSDWDIPLVPKGIFDKSF